MKEEATIFCSICGEEESMHHAFTPKTFIRPNENCCCDVEEWGVLDLILPDVCEEHVGDKEENCERCEHNFECHAAKSA